MRAGRRYPSPLGAAVVALAVVACSGPAVIDGPVEWVDDGGSPVDPSLLSLEPDECAGRRSAAVLEILWPLNPGANEEQRLRRYVRDPDLVISPRELAAPYDAASSLPQDARFTGYSGGPFQLWIGPDDDIYVYISDGPRVEALPRIVDDEPIEC